ncbi:MAG: hypothetical protein Q4E24_00990 [bacterium]|nr:hypothetical protein [bacterium]
MVDMKNAGKQEEYEEYGEKGINRKKQIFILALVSVLGMLFSLWNAAGLRRELNYSVAEYCDGITRQLTEVVKDGIY